MKKKVTKVLVIMLMMVVIGSIYVLQVKADNTVVNDFNELNSI